MTLAELFQSINDSKLPMVIGTDPGLQTVNNNIKMLSVILEQMCLSFPVDVGHDFEDDRK